MHNISIQLIYIFMLVFAMNFIFCRARLSCCLDNHVPDYCAEIMCNVNIPPNDLQRYSLFEGRNSCQNYLNVISRCLIHGRDSGECCHSNDESDTDVNSCLAMCNGTISVKNIEEFQSCFAMNADNIYSCMKESHRNAPTQPREVKITFKSKSEATIVWKIPEKNIKKLHIYKVHVLESYGKNTYESIHDTKKHFITLQNLSPMSSYTVYIVAHGLKGNGDPDYFKSTPSNILHFVTSNKIVIFRDIVKMPIGTNNAFLACNLKSIFGTNNEVEWVKFTLSGPIKMPSTMVTTYSSMTSPSMIVSSLELHNITLSDFGIYHCQIKGQSNEYGEITLQEYSALDNPPNEKPPESIIECCSRYSHRDSCQSVCTRASLNSLEPLLPGNFLPHMRCLDEFHGLLKCSLSHMNSASCCIKSKVPYKCLGMCDNNYSMEIHPGSTCLNYLENVLKCQSETLNKRPEAVSYVNYEIDNNFYKFTWEKSERASAYHVFQRNSNERKWISQSVAKPFATITNSDEVVLLAVNEHGLSQQTRLKLYKREWRISDY